MCVTGVIHVYPIQLDFRTQTSAGKGGASRSTSDPGHVLLPGNLGRSSRWFGAGWRPLSYVCWFIIPFNYRKIRENPHN